MILDTSLDAFVSIKPELGSRQAAVLDIISHLKNPSNAEISQYVGLPINTITPRVNELCKRGLVGNAGKKTCSVTGREVYGWRVK